MISIEAYRSCIGSFAFTAQRNVKSISKSILIGSNLSNTSFSKLLKPVRFVALFTLLFFAIPKSYEQTYFQTPLDFLHLTKSGIFIQYPIVAHHVGDPNLIFLKVNYTLLLSGDVELNPGPRTEDIQDIPGSNPQPNLKNFKKIVLGNFNQGHEMFGSSANKQGVTNSLFSICWTMDRNVNIWKDFDLDYILHT